MKNLKLALLLMILIVGADYTNAQNVSDILGKIGNAVGSNSKSDNGDSLLGNLLEGVFSSSDLTVEDLGGVWKASGPAVCFQGDNFLEKAGGVAAAAAIEKKLAPYYRQYGLNNATLTVSADGSFTLQTKLLRLNGNITPAPDKGKGVFEFNFTALGSIKLGSVTTYVQKTSQSMDVMFDATKLKNLLAAISKYMKSNIVQTLGGLLNSYEGLAVGFSFDKTGNAPASTGSSTGSSTDNADDNAADALLNILKNKNKKK